MDVDTVSGATFSSNGIISAVKNALTGEKDSGETGQSQSGGTAAAGSSTSVAQVEDASGYKDGTYYGTGTGFGGTLKVQVDISGGKMIKAFVPLSEMFGYATDLRSKTQGRGNYSMFFDKYEQAPKSVQDKVIASRAK